MRAVACVLVGAVVALRAIVAEVTCQVGSAVALGRNEPLRLTEWSGELNAAGIDVLPPLSLHYWVSATIKMQDGVKILNSSCGGVCRVQSELLLTGEQLPQVVEGTTQVAFQARMPLSSDAAAPNGFGARTVLIGPIVRGSENGAMRTTMRLLQSNASMTLITVKAVSEVFCFECPAGYRATACDPLAGQSTKCAKCDSNVTGGRYCTGAQPSYRVESTQLVVDSPRVARPSETGYFCGRVCPLGAVDTFTWVYSFFGAAPGTDTAVCPAGYTCRDGQLTDCTTYSVGDPLAPPPARQPAVFCPQGSGAATPSELPCPAGSFCPTVIEKVLCPEGSACPAGSDKPSPCPAGSACPAGSESPAACPAGSFTSRAGQATCEQCASGTFQNVAGKLSCKSCPDSTVAPLPGAVACTACDPTGTERFDPFIAQCKCKAGAFGPTCTPGAARPVSGAGNGGASAPGSAPPSGSSGAGGSSAVLIVAAGVAAVALLSIAVMTLKRRREASAALQPASGADLSARL